MASSEAGVDCCGLSGRFHCDAAPAQTGALAPLGGFGGMKTKGRDASVAALDMSTKLREPPQKWVVDMNRDPPNSDVHQREQDN